MSTAKLCNFRNCLDGTHEACPHDAVDPCKVFRNTETGHWYDEVTGQPIRHFRQPDGQLFDVQMWLEAQLRKACQLMLPESACHEEFRIGKPTHRQATKSPRPPAFTMDELDHLADAFIRNKHQRKPLEREVRELGKEIQGYVRMQRKWGDNPLLKEKLAELREERKAKQAILNEMAKFRATTTKHLRTDNKWTEQWMPKSGSVGEYVLYCEFDGQIWCIDRHGLKVEGDYVYLPDLDRQFVESANAAERLFHIPKKAWSKFFLSQERIGGTIRRTGKKNANGRRIRSRVDQIKYAYNVRDMAKACRKMHISLYKILRDEELYEHYLKHIKPRLSRG